MSGRILLIIVPSDQERAAFNSSLSLTTHRSIYALDDDDGYVRFVEVRPDLVVLPFTGEDDFDHVARSIKRMRNEPCGKNIPVVLYNYSGTQINDARGLLKKLGASAFIPWPPRAELLNKAIGILTQELSTDSAVPSIQEEATAEITINHADELEIDPLLAQAARALDEEVDDIPTNPRQSISENNLDSVEIRVSDSSFEMEVSIEKRSKDPASNPPVISSTGHSNTKELIPVFRAPSGLEATPVKVTRAYVENDSPGSVSTSDSSVSVPEFLREPELPSRETGSARLSDTARKRIQEIPRGGVEDSVSVSQESVPLSAPESAPGLASRKGLDESRLGKRLVRRINKTFDALDSLSYYELLGVDLSVNGKALRDAYFSLSLEFHPDRFFLMTSGDLKEKIYAVFRRINEAYVVLSDDRRRETYDKGLSSAQPLKRAVSNARGFAAPETNSVDSSQPFSVRTQSPQAEDFVRRAQLSYKDHDFDGARLYLTLASLCEPQSVSIEEAIKTVISTRPSLNSCLRW